MCIQKRNFSENKKPIIAAMKPSEIAKRIDCEATKPAALLFREPMFLATRDNVPMPIPSDTVKTNISTVLLMATALIESEPKLPTQNISIRLCVLCSKAPIINGNARAMIFLGIFPVVISLSLLNKYLIFSFKRRTG